MAAIDTTSPEHMEYRIATDLSAPQLEARVSNLIRAGWVPIGGVAIKPATAGSLAVYAQALTRTPVQGEAVVNSGAEDRPA